MFFSYTSWKHEKLRSFLSFSGGIEKEHWPEMGYPFYDGGPFHIETSALIYSSNQWTGFYMIGTSVMKELT